MLEIRHADIGLCVTLRRINATLHTKQVYKSLMHSVVKTLSLSQHIFSRGILQYLLSCFNICGIVSQICFEILEIFVSNAPISMHSYTLKLQCYQRYWVIANALDVLVKGRWMPLWL